MDQIEDAIKQGNYSLALDCCTNYSLKTLLSKVFKIETTNTIRVKLMCNFCSSKDIVKLWNKMSMGNGRWNNIQITDSEPADFYVVINSTNSESFDKKKTIVFQMEPKMSENPQIWGEWANPKDEDFLKVVRHSNDYNNNEWHLSKTYKELTGSFHIEKQYDILSTVLSEKYTDSGHVKRVDFVKFLERKDFPVHVFGSNKWDYKEYKGSLPYHCKDNAIFPYKYTFNVENQSIKNYYTEKLIDGILGECLVFYSGCYNVCDFIDPRAFVYLELSNFEKDYETVKRAINEDWYSKRIEYIRAEKTKILNCLQFFPRLESILKTYMKL